MASGAETPLFNWPAEKDGQTWDPKNKRHVYPSSKTVPQDEEDSPTDVVKQLLDIETRVKTVLNVIDYGAGNIHRMIAKDLASLASLKEFDLLPKLYDDYHAAQYAGCITEKCKAMLREKIKRYQRQHAHNMALEEMVDIVLKWQCSSKGPQPVRMLPENELNYVKIAHECRYKYLDWDLEHADEKEYDDPVKRQPGEVRKPPREDPSIPSPAAEHHGGFYTCVIQDLLPFLENLSPVWTATVEVVVHPKLMTEDEQKEMDEYHAARSQAEDKIKLEKALEKLEIERNAREERKPKAK